ncbi:MAG TPA: phosphoribosyltransferase family protein [Usitatibacter sp.]|nr:phosphoribosyltransferase family protein [Usitatibacter sp.]
MYFDDRVDAARQLAEALRTVAGDHPLVLAIPRGAVPMGRVIADALGGDLDVVLVRKIGAPMNPEYAVGSVDESGWTYVADHAGSVGADEAYLAAERRKEMAVMARRRALYTPGRAAHDPKGRDCIVLDDGLATGATMIAALHSVRAKHPRKLVCAVPVASRTGLAHVGFLADEVVCLARPVDFQAVGQFYRRFDAVQDDEVAALLRGAPHGMHAPR